MPAPRDAASGARADRSLRRPARSGLNSVVTVTERAPIENCDECGFRWDGYTDEQAVGVFLVAGGLFRAVRDGGDLDRASTRPVWEWWAVRAYADSMRAWDGVMT